MKIFEDISNQELEKVLPYFFVSDSNFKIVYVGKNLNKLIPRLKNKKIDNIFNVKKQKKTINLNKLPKQESYNSLTLIPKSKNNLIFTGKFFRIKNNKKFIFSIIPEYSNVSIKTEDKYKTIIENLNLGVLEVDANNFITKVFSKFCELTGFTEQELIGKKFEDILWGEADFKIMELQNLKRGKGIAEAYDICVRKKDNQPAWFTLSGAPIFNNSNKTIIGSIGINLDITEKKKTEYELFAAKEYAEKLLKSKQFFLANLTHELRTPLNVIIGMSELLFGKQVKKEVKNDLDVIYNSATHLLAIVNDILDYSKLEAGKILLNNSVVSLKDLLFEQIQLHLNQARKKNIKLKINIDKTIPDKVIADELRLKQIISNLLSNAIKYTQKGSVSVSCSLIDESEKNLKFLFKVSDTGIGIPEDKKQAIFQSFVQAMPEVEKIFGGTGLGLSIVKSLVSILDGKLWCESKIGKGSDFYVELSLNKVDNKLQKNDSTISKNYFKLNCNILVVDDNELNRLVVVRTLNEWGCKTSIATNGKECLNLLDKETFDLILMDIQMPVLDGFEATRNIRAHPISHIKNLPVIAMSAYSFAELNQKCSESGIDDLISKPFQHAELYNKIVFSLSKSKKATSNILNNNFNYLNKISGGDTQFINEVIEIFIKQTPLLISKLIDSENKKDYAQILKLLHKLKPELKIFDKKELTEDLIKMEDNIKSKKLKNLKSQLNNFIFNLEKFSDSLIKRNPKLVN